MNETSTFDPNVLPALSLRNITRHYQQGEETLRIFEGAMLDIWPGQIVALVGPSGAGKSSLLHIAGLLEAPDAGEHLVHLLIACVHLSKIYTLDRPDLRLMATKRLLQRERHLTDGRARARRVHRQRQEVALSGLRAAGQRGERRFDRARIAAGA